ncbi:M23 family metallopeptidase [candidate division KSB1 bacterium]|nr:M23 family metallopeptidase [candidate division KSB1 bacterium]
MEKFYCWIWITILFFSQQVLKAQDYAWPTDASTAMTSSFAESRPGRFHAGLDVKTWGQEGYDVYAVRPGYVSRIRVSPFGYGRAIYLTLDTGETVILAHLQKFNEEIEEYIYDRQIKDGKFQVDLYPASGRFRYAQGALLGYTGQTGIGSPHLHFEIRDKTNHPFNPLMCGYKLHDTVSPVITKISVTPMDGFSTVDGDWQPVIFNTVPISAGKYIIKDAVHVYGRITFGVSAYDQMDGISNRFGTYINRFFVDNRQIFSACYDKYAYSENHCANLDRNYRLRMLGRGLFYQLFRDDGNDLPFYDGESSYHGMLNFLSQKDTQLPDDIRSLWPSDLVTFGPGQHEFEIQISDFWGNTSTVSGRLIAVQRAALTVAQEKDNTDADLVIKSDIPQSECTLYVTDGNNTKTRQYVKKDTTGGLLTPHLFPFKIPLWDSAGPMTVKAVTRDRFGFESMPAFYLLGESAINTMDVQVSVQYEFYDNYIRFGIRFSDAVSVEAVDVWEKTGRAVPVTFVAENISRYYGVCSRLPQNDGPLILDIRFVARDGLKKSHREILPFFAVKKNQSKRLRTMDVRCFFDFDPQSLYKDSYVTTAVDSISLIGSDRVSHLYSIGPVTAPIYRGYNLSIAIPPGDSLPEKLAIYYLTDGNRWIFQGNRFQPKSGLISAYIGDFGTFALVRDTTPPEVRFLYPAHNSHMNNKKPKVYVVFKDDLSGVSGENNMQLFLDGQKLIAEYDPDKRTLFCQVRESLTVGRHLLKCHIRDRSGNDMERTHVFFID